MSSSVTSSISTISESVTGVQSLTEQDSTRRWFRPSYWQSALRGCSTRRAAASESRNFGVRDTALWREYYGRDRNFVAAFFSLIALTLLSAALADEEWFSLSGGPCVLKHLGVTLFYRMATLQVHYSKPMTGSESLGPLRHVTFDTGVHKYEDCVDSKIVNLFIGIMGICLVAVLTNLGALILDVIGTKSGFSRWLRQNAIFSVFSVFLCILIIGLSYWLSLVIEEQQMLGHDPDNVHIGFEDGFYLVVCSGLLSICAVSANLLRSSLLLKRRSEDRLGLLDNAESSPRSSLFDQFYPGSVLPPPPPPYAP